MQARFFVGTHSGYNSSGEAHTQNMTAEEFKAKAGLPKEAEVIPGFALYNKEWGCPEGGEFGFNVVLSQGNNLNINNFKATAVMLAEQSREALLQSTVQIQFADEGFNPELLDETGIGHEPLDYLYLSKEQDAAIVADKTTFNMEHGTHTSNQNACIRYTFYADKPEDILAKIQETIKDIGDHTGVYPTVTATVDKNMISVESSANPAFVNDMSKWVEAQQHLCQEVSKEVGTQIQTIVNGERVPITIEDVKKMKTVQVHNGVFHADDVYCVALLKQINPDIKVIRSRGQEKVDLRCDVGLGPYDHHGKEDRQYRFADAENGEHGQYAAFGKLWEDLGEQLVGKDGQLSIDETLVSYIDRADNGEEQNPLSAMISSFAPTWDSHETMDDAFSKAVAVASQNLENQIEYNRSLTRAKNVIHEAVQNMENDIIHFEQYTPWNDSKELIESDAKYVIFPASTGEQWNLQCVPPAIGSFAQKAPIAFDKAGFGSGCKFVHPGKFFAAFTTREAAEKAAEQCIAYYQEKEQTQVKEKALKQVSLKDQFKNVKKVMPEEERKEQTQRVKQGQGHDDD